MTGLTDLTIKTIEGDSEIDRHLRRSRRTRASRLLVDPAGSFESGQAFASCQSLIPVYMFPDLGHDLQQNRRMIDIMANKYAYLPQKATCRIYVRPAGSEKPACWIFPAARRSSSLPAA